jgi:hypothetical protein
MATAFHALSAPFSATVAAWAKGSPNRKNWTDAEANGMGFVLDIPFRCKAAKEIRDLAKLCGARFDGGTKSWSVAYSALTPKAGGYAILKLNTLNALGVIKAAIPARVAGYCPRDIGLRYIVLSVGFDQKDRAKAAGAQWNSLGKYWYMTVQTTPAFSDSLKAFEADGLVDHAKTNDLAIKCASISQPYRAQSLGAPLKPFSAPQGQELFRQAPLRRARYSPKPKPNHTPVGVSPVATVATVTPTDPLHVRFAQTLATQLRNYGAGPGDPNNLWEVRGTKRVIDGILYINRYLFSPSSSVVVIFTQTVPPHASAKHLKTIPMRPAFAEGKIDYRVSDAPSARKNWAYDIEDGYGTALMAALSQLQPESAWVGERAGEGTTPATAKITPWELFQTINRAGTDGLIQTPTTAQLAHAFDLLQQRSEGKLNKWLNTTV